MRQDILEPDFTARRGGRIIDGQATYMAVIVTLLESQEACVATAELFHQRYPGMG